MPTNKQVAGEIGNLLSDEGAIIKAAIHHKGEERMSKGQMADNLPEIDNSFKFNEGSVSKVRLSLLGYALDQDKTNNFNLEQNAQQLFAQGSFKEYLEDRYPGKGQALGNFIDDLFTEDNKGAKIVDLLTHRAGVGDLTRDHSQFFDKKGQGLEKQYDLADLLLVDPYIIDNPVARTNGKPHAQSAPWIANDQLPEGRFGDHQYSNMSYMLAGLVIEYQTEQPLHKLHDQYFLHPTKGRAAQKENKGGIAIEFNNTIPQDVNLGERYLPKMPFYDPATNSVADASKFNGANSAGGFRTTAEDLARFMEESFKGFPGTKDKPGSNPYFIDDTIAKMMEEGKKFGHAGLNTKNRTANYQMAGFVTTVRVPEGIDMDDFSPSKEQLEEMFQSENIISYNKTGGIPGSKTFANFYPQKGEAEVTVFLKENITPKIDKLLQIAQNRKDNPDFAKDKIRDAERFASSLGIEGKDFVDKFQLNSYLQHLVEEVHSEAKEGNEEKKQQYETKGDKPKPSFKPNSAISNDGEIHASFNDGPNDHVLQTLKHKLKTAEEVKSGKSSWVDRVSQESDPDRSR